MGRTRIEWCNAIWNPVTGCSPVSVGCQNCYAKRFAERLRGRCGYPTEKPFRVTLHPERLEEPLHWRRPRLVFAVSMGDLFHEDVPEWFIDRVFAIMALAKQHIFIVLTKRPERTLEWYTRTPSGATREQLVHDAARSFHSSGIWPGWPLPNVWPGTSVENQEMADKRIPKVLQIPAAVRVVSVEPMLGPARIASWLVKCRDPEHRHIGSCEVYGHRRLDWVICGGETGPGARPMHPEWVRGLRDQCVAAGVPFFFKSWGTWYPIYGSGQPRGDKDRLHTPFIWVSPNGEMFRSGVYPDALMLKLGKHAAYRMLDGQEWRQFPSGMRQ